MTNFKGPAYSNPDFQPRLDLCDLREISVNSGEPAMPFTDLIFLTPEDARGSCVAILGGGGKTGLLLTLGKELATSHPRVLMTSLTRASRDSHVPIVYQEQVPALNLAALFKHTNPVYILGSAVNATKAAGINPETLRSLHAQADLTLVECDGAARHSLKVHREPDPLVPACATRVIIVAGADVVDARGSSATVHRWDLFRQHWSLEEHSRLTPQLIARVLTSPRGYLSRIPGRLPLVYFINKADRYPAQARRLARALAAVASTPVWTGSLRAGTLERAG